MLHFIVAPYHLGQRGVAVGAGPLRIQESGIADRIQATAFEAQGNDTHEVNRQIADLVRAARNTGAFPLVIAGNCNSCLGTLAGLADLQPGIVWFDAHGDFHTPETSISGLLEGMSLTLATQHFTPQQPIILAGARDLDPGEMERVHQRLLYIPTAELHLQPLPDASAVYVHIDLDVLDPAISPGVNFQGSGGLSVEKLREALAFTFKRYNVAAVALANYNPAKDVDDRTCDIAISLIEDIALLRQAAASR